MQYKGSHVTITLAPYKTLTGIFDLRNFTKYPKMIFYNTQSRLVCNDDM